MASEDEGNEGMSTPKKVATGAAVGLATAAAVGVGKKLLGSNGDSDDDGGESGRSSDGTSRTPLSRSTGSTTRSKSGSGSKTSSRSRTTSSSRTRSGSSSSRRSGGTTRTKEQLYAQAKRLNIDGRSRMTKAQLERAVARARS